MEGDLNALLLDVVLPLVLIFIMLGMGMTLTTGDFLRLREYPRAVAGGLLGQIILLPLVGGALAAIWGLSPELAVGLVVLAACPGGTTSNLVSHLAHGDRPLSITLTAANSCIVLFTIPLIAAAAMDVFAGRSGEVPMPWIPVIFGIFVYTLLPVSVGMTIRRFAPTFARRVGPLYDRLAALAFLLIVLSILWTGRDDLMLILPMAGTVTLALNLIMTAIGLGLAFLLAVGTRQALTLGIEVGIQNTVLGMAVAGTLLDGVQGLNGQIMLIPAAVYGLLMFGPATVIIVYGRRRLTSQLAAAAPQPAGR